MDKIDLKILQALDEDARQPFSKISKNLRVSRQVVKYRYDKLVKEGVLKYTYAMVNVTKLGKTAFRTFIRFGKITPEEEKELIQFIKKLPGLFWLARFYGKWDLVFQFLEEDILAYEKKIQPILQRFEKHFQERNLTTITELHEYPHNFLFEKQADFSFESKGRTIQSQIDEKDESILRFLASDGRMTSAELAKNLKLTREAIAARIKRLVKEKYILGFRPEIDFKNLGYLHIKVFLHFHNHSLKEEQRLLTWLRFQPNVVYATKALSYADREFELYVKDIEELYQIMNQLRQEFSDLLREWDSLIVHKVEKVNYFP
jgi:DNA-binding Lrp family transcriptional regulator